MPSSSPYQTRAFLHDTDEEPGVIAWVTALNAVGANGSAAARVRAALDTDPSGGASFLHALVPNLEVPDRAEARAADPGFRGQCQAVAQFIARRGLTFEVTLVDGVGNLSWAVAGNLLVIKVGTDAKAFGEDVPQAIAALEQQLDN